MFSKKFHMSWDYVQAYFSEIIPNSFTCALGICVSFFYLVFMKYFASCTWGLSSTASVTVKAIAATLQTYVHEWSVESLAQFAGDNGQWLDEALVASFVVVFGG